MTDSLQHLDFMGAAHQVFSRCLKRNGSRLEQLGLKVLFWRGTHGLDYALALSNKKNIRNSEVLVNAVLQSPTLWQELKSERWTSHRAFQLIDTFNPRQQMLVLGKADSEGVKLDYFENLRKKLMGMNLPTPKPVGAS